MKAKTYDNILKDATTKYDNTIQQVDSNGNLTWYFYVEVESGEVVKTRKTYVIGQGEFKQPTRTKFYKTMHRMLDTLGNGVVMCGYALMPPLGCVYAQPPHDSIGGFTTT